MDLTHVRFSGTPTFRRRPERRIDDRRAVPHGAAPPSEPVWPVLGKLPAYVLRAAGLPTESYRNASLERRTAACLRALKARSEDEAIAALQARPALLDRALSAFLIGVSEFFRDPATFNVLERLVVPQLARLHRPLRVASVGCSTGEELYSVAMLLAEGGLLPSASLIGTDCRAEAILHARAGIYSPADVAGIPAAFRHRYFDSFGLGVRIAEPLRAAVRWEARDALRGTTETAFDLVLCRNLVIYLQPSAGAALLRRLAVALAPGGFMVLGKAERPPPGTDLTSFGRFVYRKHGE